MRRHGPNGKRRRGGRPGRLAGLVTAAVVAMSVPVLLAPGSAKAATPCDAPVVNAVACENTKAGTPESDWGIVGSGSSAIQGFATSMSVQPGDTVQFKIKSSTAYKIDILRLGYYQGNGA